MISKKQKGVTVIETLVYMAVFSILLTAISVTMITIYRAHDFAMSNTSAMVDMRRALELAVSNIKEAGFSDAGAYPVVSMSENEFVFYSDIDNDSKVEKVRFFVDGDVFKQGIIDSSGLPPTYDASTEVIKPIAWHIRNTSRGVPVFNFFNKQMQKITNMSKILDLRMVSLRLLIDTDTSRPPSYYDFYSSATLRNITNAYDKW